MGRKKSRMEKKEKKRKKIVRMGNPFRRRRVGERIKVGKKRRRGEKREIETSHELWHVFFAVLDDFQSDKSAHADFFHHILIHISIVLSSVTHFPNKNKIPKNQKRNSQKFRLTPKQKERKEEKTNTNKRAKKLAKKRNVKVVGEVEKAPIL